MKTCNGCEHHVEAGLEDVAFFYHVCTYKQIRGIGKSRIICGKVRSLIPAGVRRWRMKIIIFSTH